MSSVFDRIALGQPEPTQKVDPRQFQRDWIVAGHQHEVASSTLALGRAVEGRQPLEPPRRGYLHGGRQEPSPAAVFEEATGKVPRPPGVSGLAGGFASGEDRS